MSPHSIFDTISNIYITTALFLTENMIRCRIRYWLIPYFGTSATRLFVSSLGEPHYQQYHVIPIGLSAALQATYLYVRLKRREMKQQNHVKSGALRKANNKHQPLVSETP